MVPAGGRPPVSGGHDKLDAQHEQWQSTFRGNPDMYGTDPSEPGAYAVGLFAHEQIRDLLELGAGQGRDTLAFLRAGLTVTALDYATSALNRLQQAATDAGLADRLTTVAHDVRQPLPLPGSGFDAVYSHMLFNMALTTTELETLSSEVRRVLRPAGLHVYTVRHTGDAHYGAGTSHGDSMFENGGFIVHFFDRALVDRLVTGFTLLGLSAFEEGSLPRRLWRITLRREDAPLAPPFVPRGTGAAKARRLTATRARDSPGTAAQVLLPRLGTTASRHNAATVLWIIVLAATCPDPG